MREYPNFAEEKKLWKKGYKYVAGLDEAGRGALAGPVVASLVVVTTAKIKNQKSKIKNAIQNLKIKDSKKLLAKQREELYKVLTKHPQIRWGVGKVSEKVIDKINILEATKLAMKKALKNLEKKQRIQKISDRRNFVSIDFLILDGNFKIDLPIPQKPIIKADEKVFSCTLASIIAKVTRDRIMKRYQKKYPQYGFDRHKGYPTKYHIKMLKKFGPSPIHRLTYKPLNLIKVFRKVVSGEKRGEKIGFPTLNFPLKNGDKIKRGVWLVRLKIGKKEYFGLANVGRAKTFNERKERIEVHLFSQPIKKIKKTEIHFLRYLRKTKKFKKIEDLKKQIKKDIKKAKFLLAHYSSFTLEEFSGQVSPL
jgi:ribonuclease HII